MPSDPVESLDDYAKGWMIVSIMLDGYYREAPYNPFRDRTEAEAFAKTLKGGKIVVNMADFMQNMLTMHHEDGTHNDKPDPLCPLCFIAR